LRIELITADPARPAAMLMQQRLCRSLGVDDECVMAVSGHAQVSDLLVLLVDTDNLAACGQACSQAQRQAPGCAVLAVGESTVHEQLEALLGSGATDLLYLPVSDSELGTRVRRALGREPTADKLKPPVETPALDARLRHMVGCSPAFVELLGQLPTLAGCDAGVLILGETGTGKEVFAQALHYLSARAAKPWVPINCGAIPTELIESELFGHLRGAYTTAHAARSGLVDEAAGGTLFLDDVDCLPLAAQTKLLRLLQEREYRAVGSNTLRHADIRVIAASNRDLGQQAQRGLFRQDLYYRLNVLSLSLPPLRERREDIAALARHFVQQFARQRRRPGLSLAPQALSKLMRYDWPGNVRELQHVIERAVLLSSGSLLGAADMLIDAPCDASGDEPDVTFQDAKARVVERFERDYIERLLLQCRGNITQAARHAGKHRRAFFELIRKHGIELATFRGPP
jgi:two-component system, NtrC family, response regulator GlrR